MWSELRAVLADDWRRSWPRYVAEGVLFAAVVVAFAYVSRDSRLRNNPPPRFHTMMADLCEEESRLMRSRAETCRDWAARGLASDAGGREGQDLRICPYPADVPRVPSWSEQADVWERAAEKSARAARRHRGAAFWEK